MTHDEQVEQDTWLRAELAKPRTTPFLAAVAHHPLYTNGIHRDNPILLTQWDALLRQYKVDLYISGHDHDLQHLEFSEHPTSFVVSGGGGAELNPLLIPPDKRGPWGKQVLGFTDFELTHDAATPAAHCLRCTGTSRLPQNTRRSGEAAEGLTHSAPLVPPRVTGWSEP